MNNTRLMELSTEILDNVHLRLPTSCLFCLRYVSKTSKNIVECACFVTLPMPCLLSVQSTVASNQVPLLILFDQFFFDSHCGFAFTPLKYNGINTILKRIEDHAIVSSIMSAKISASYSLGFVFHNLFFFRDNGYTLQRYILSFNI